MCEREREKEREKEIRREREKEIGRERGKSQVERTRYREKENTQDCFWQ